jgi:hypothetical protein
MPLAEKWSTCIQTSSTRMKPCSGNEDVQNPGREFCSDENAWVTNIPPSSGNIYIPQNKQELRKICGKY